MIFRSYIHLESVDIKSDIERYGRYGDVKLFRMRSLCKKETATIEFYRASAGLYVESPGGLFGFPYCFEDMSADCFYFYDGVEFAKEFRNNAQSGRLVGGQLCCPGRNLKRGEASADGVNSGVPCRIRDDIWPVTLKGTSVKMGINKTDVVRGNTCLMEKKTQENT